METKTNSQALSVGVIGADGMGTCHALNLHGAVGNARVAAVYNLDQDRARQVARMCGQALVFNDPERLINDPQVDAVVIVSPDHIQAMLTLACLGAGKPVLSEKPLTTTADTALVLSEARRAPPALKIGWGVSKMLIYEKLWNGSNRSRKAGPSAAPIHRTVA